jgi:hypothetical protein
MRAVGSGRVLACPNIAGNIRRPVILAPSQSRRATTGSVAEARSAGAVAAAPLAMASTTPADTLNPARSATAARSAALDLSAPDRIDESEMNSILWLALRDQLPMPPTTRAAFRRTTSPKADSNPANEP